MIDNEKKENTHIHRCITYTTQRLSRSKLLCTEDRTIEAPRQSQKNGKKKNYQRTAYNKIICFMLHISLIATFFILFESVLLLLYFASFVYCKLYIPSPFNSIENDLHNILSIRHFLLCKRG